MGKFIIILFILIASNLSLQAQSDWNKINAKGQKTGSWKQLHKNGQVRYIGQFKDGIPIDTFRYFAENGKLTSLMIYSVNGYSTAFIYYENGDLKASGTYHNQKKDGVWKYYNSAKILVTEESFKDSIKNGVWKIYFENGKLATESNWKNGKLNGVTKEYFENGNLKVSSNYVDDKLQGDYLVYFENGSISLSGKYVMGTIEGKWLNYLQDGKISKISYYQKGILIKEEVFKDGILNNTIKY